MTSSDENDDVTAMAQTFETRLHTLLIGGSSSSLSSSKRAIREDNAELLALHNLVLTSKDVRMELGSGGLAIKAARQCGSCSGNKGVVVGNTTTKSTTKHTSSYEKLAGLIVDAIIAELSNTDDTDDELLSPAVEEIPQTEGEGYGTGEDNIRILCRALCRTLCLSQNMLLLASCGSQLLTKWPISKAMTTDAPILLHKEFEEVAVHGGLGVFYPALSLASLLLPLSYDVASSSLRRLTDVFIERTFQSSSSSTSAIQLPSPTDISMARPFLRKAAATTIFDARSSPIISQRLRSHPEKSLPLIETILSSYNRSYLGEVTNETTSASEMNQDLIPAVIRQLRSTKLFMRVYASRTLIHLVTTSTSSSTTTLVVRAICNELVGDTAVSSDLRAGAYAALDGIAKHLLTANGEGNEEANYVLLALMGCLPKDKLVTTVTSRVSSVSVNESVIDNVSLPSAKESGMNALLSWMRLYKRQPLMHDSEGYVRALDYLAEPIIKYTPKDGEFRFRLGSLIVPPSNTIGGADSKVPVGGGAGSDEAFVMSVVCNLLVEGTKGTMIRNGLTTIVDAAAKKHVSSNVMPQVDGALAVYCLVLHGSKMTAASSNSCNIPASVSKVIIAGATEGGHETSFLYSPAFLELARTDALSNYILHRIISRHRNIEGVAKDKPLVRILPKRLEEGRHQPYSAATRALSVCVAYPRSPSSLPSIRTSIDAVVSSSLTSASVADAISFALFDVVNERLLVEPVIVTDGEDLDREDEDGSDEDDDEDTIDDYCESSEDDDNTNDVDVRSVANSLLSGIICADALCRVLLLSHVGVSTHSYRRNAMAVMLKSISNAVLPFVEKQDNVEKTIDSIASFIAFCATSTRMNFQPKKESDASESNVTDRDPIFVSSSIHIAATSLIRTLGGIAGRFDDDVEDVENIPYAFASAFCVQKLPHHLMSQLTDCLSAVESLTKEDIELFLSPKGVLFRPAGDAAHDIGGGVKSTTCAAKKKMNKGGGFDAAEDEEWERQVKIDLDKKKKKKEEEQLSSSTSDKALSPKEKELITYQTARREEISEVLTDYFPRTLAAIRCVCKSDIEVGNSILPILGQIVIHSALSTCAAHSSVEKLKNDAFDTLSTMVSCVYEIDENHAPSITRALMMSFVHTAEEGSTQKGKVLTISPLPSPCNYAALAITEMDDYGACLSGCSFSFLFPILRAALIGPKNVPGCEAALSVLQRHCTMLAGDEADMIVKSLRRDMALTILELLSHDRSLTFADPTPYDSLIDCFRTNEESSGPVFSTSEIAPLLGDSGALGCENTRVASMEALASIAQRHPKLIRSNPLIENRVWFNCFDKNDRVRNAARRCWLVAHGYDNDEIDDACSLDPPSKLYAVPMLPLLSHKDDSIACAAAVSLAAAMGLHPDSVEKNVVKLCNTYIAQFPASGEEDQPQQSSSSPFPIQPPAATKNPVKKKVIDTGIPKKKTAKVSSVTTSMAKITGASVPKKSAATKKLLAKVAAPKVERTLDQSEFMDQFKTQASVKKITAEEDSDSKVVIRLGVIRAISSLTDSSAKVKLDIPVLKIIIGFLLAFGLGDGNESVRNASRNAARDIVATYGSSDEAIGFLLPQLESVLKTGQVEALCVDPPLNAEKIPKTNISSDQRKEGVVVSLGSIALHLKDVSDATKIDDIIDMLIGALNTPSEDVQSSVALCLSKIMKKGRTQERMETILNDLMKECTDGSSLASRRGSAYGISAAVKGSGIASLKKYAVVKRLEETCTSGTPSSKEGALFCIELLSSRLGILFEPYVIVLLPALLKAFSDSNDYVRVAASKTVGLIMGNLSGHGVKLVMPAVLDAFDEPEWRTKQASIHMLGR